MRRRVPRQGRGVATFPKALRHPHASATIRRVILAAGDSLLASDAGVLLLAAAGTGIGAVARDAVVALARRRLARADLGILAANLAATAIAALAALVEPSARGHAFVALGVAGGLSTWSALAVECAGLLRARRWGRLLLHLPGAFVVAAVLAWSVARAVVPAGPSVPPPVVPLPSIEMPTGTPTTAASPEGGVP